MGDRRTACASSGRAGTAGIDRPGGALRLLLGVPLALLLGALAGTPGPAVADSFDGSTTDDWDVSRGAAVVTHSGVVGGSSIDDLFGAENASVEPRTTIFADGRAEGFVHFVEWTTPTLRAVDGYVLRANDDGVRTKNRAFSAFRLYARDTGTGEFVLVATYAPPRTPYGEQITVMGTFPAVLAQDFRAEFVQAGGPANGGPRVRELDTSPAPVNVTSGIFPLRASVKFAPDPSRSKLTVVGKIDTGHADPSFGASTSLGLASFTATGVLPVADPPRFTVTGGGFSFAVTPGKAGSSRAPFRMQFTGDVSGAVDPDGEVPLSYAAGAADLNGTFRLEHGKYDVHGLGSLRAPSFHVESAKVKLAGPGKDKFTLTLSASRIESIPTNTVDVRLSLGDDHSFLIPASAFRRRGQTFLFTGGNGGVRSAALDYERGLFRFSGTGLDLSDLAAPGGGPTDLRIAVALGVDRRSQTIRLGRTGSVLRY